MRGCRPRWRWPDLHRSPARPPALCPCPRVADRCWKLPGRDGWLLPPRLAGPADRAARTHAPLALLYPRPDARPFLRRGLRPFRPPGGKGRFPEGLARNLRYWFGPVLRLTAQRLPA